MLTITGTNLGVTVETRTPPVGATWTAFEQHTLSLMVEGRGGKPVIEDVDLTDLVRDRDADLTSLGTLNETVEVAVSVSAYPTKRGAGYRLSGYAVRAVAQPSHV